MVSSIKSRKSDVTLIKMNFICSCWWRWDNFAVKKVEKARMTSIFMKIAYNSDKKMKKYRFILDLFFRNIY